MEQNYKIKVTDVSKLNEHYKEAIQEGTYEGEDVNKFFNTIKTFDIAESLLKKDFSNQFINFEIITDKEKIPLNIRLGDKNFQKGIDHLINIGSSQINKESINPNTKENLNNQVGSYKPTTYDQMLDGTFKALKDLSEIVNKDIAAMVLTFSKSFSEARKDYNKENQLSTKEPSFFKQKMSEFFKKKLNKKQFDKEITADKTRSLNR